MTKKLYKIVVLQYLLYEIYYMLKVAVVYLIKNIQTEGSFGGVSVYGEL